MKITRIETLHNEKVAVVRVRTDDGAEGIGQTAPFHADITAQVLHRMVAPVFLHQNPWDLSVLVKRCLDQHYKFTGTFLYRALCGLDTAIWDLLGKMTGQPVYQLLGGKLRTRIPVYASSMLRTTTPEQEVQRISNAVSRHGFRCAKVKISGRMGQQDVDAAPGRSERLIPLLRDAVGEDIELKADANGGYSIHKAIQIGRLLEKHSYHHYEEPCPFMDVESTAAVAAALDIPVAGGEQDNSLHQFHRMIHVRAVDIVQPDVGYIGGVTRARRVAEMAEQAGIPCTPHCANPSMLQVFSLHLAASMPACYDYQEYWLGDEDHWAHHVYEPVPQVRDGYLDVPNTPGWGVTLLPEFGKQAEITTSE
jgi:L-alanine-DL-glutamate epimerase-like enolase superfamily enzyme